MSLGLDSLNVIQLATSLVIRYAEEPDLEDVAVCICLCIYNLILFFSYGKPALYMSQRNRMPWNFYSSKKTNKQTVVNNSDYPFSNVFYPKGLLFICSGRVTKGVLRERSCLTWYFLMRWVCYWFREAFPISVFFLAGSSSYIPITTLCLQHYHCNSQNWNKKINYYYKKSQSVYKH